MQDAQSQCVSMTKCKCIERNIGDEKQQMSCAGEKTALVWPCDMAWMKAVVMKKCRSLNVEGT